MTPEFTALIEKLVSVFVIHRQIRSFSFNFPDGGTTLQCTVSVIRGNDGDTGHSFELVTKAEEISISEAYSLTELKICTSHDVLIKDFLEDFYDLLRLARPVMRP